MQQPKKNPDAGGVGARNVVSVAANSSEITLPALKNQEKKLPGRAVLARRWPALRINRLTWRWIDDATGARGDDLESLRDYIGGGAR